MFATADFTFDLVKYPYQLISRHRTTVKQEWDKYHAHPGMEFIFVHEGQGAVIIDQTIYSFGPGTLMYFQPFQLHHVKAELQSGCYIRSKALFDPALIHPQFACYRSLQDFFRYLWEDELTHQVLHLPPDSAGEFEALFALRPRLQPAGEESLEGFSLFMAAFLQIAKHHWPARSEPSGSQSQLRHIHYAERIMRWINAHFREEFSLTALAQELHLSNYHVSHLFKKATGSTITDYLISRRLREACVLLSSTQLPVQELSAAVGISNSSYFCRLFKNKYGLTPAQYRTQTLSR